MKHIEFGVPESSAMYLIGGFSACMGGRRWLSQVARMKLFLPKGKPNRFTLSVWYNLEQEVELLLNGSSLGRAQIKGTKEVETFPFDVPGDLVKSEDVLEFRCKNPHPLDAYVPRCLELVSLEVAEWNEPEPPKLEKPNYNLYFGDIHVHSNLSPCGRPNNGTSEENYQWAREDGWDFVALADHDTHMSDEMWKYAVQTCQKYDEPGKLATLFAYEWTSFFYGQMNLCSPSEKLPLYRCTDHGYESPLQLWKALKDCGVPAFTVYHHTASGGHATTWDYYDPKMLPLVEIYSVWRSSETPAGYAPKGRRKLAGSSVRDALARGLRVGFVGGGDTHELRPGTRGIAGVYATELTKEAVWEALKAKRCYATTGVKIGLEFSIAGVGMGGEIAFTPYTQDILFPAPCVVGVKGTAPIRNIEVFDNGELLYSQPGNFGLREVVLQFKIENLVRVQSNASVSTPSHAYYVRVTQEDGNMAWSSPIYLVRDWSGIE